MKKICSTVISAFLAVGCFNINNLVTYADGEPSISISDVKGENGETVEVEVELSNNPGIIALCFDVKYDADKLKLIEAEDGKILGTSTSLFGKDTTANPYRLCWDDLSDKNNEGNGIVATLTFEVLTDATGEANVDLILNQGSTFNIDFENVEFAVSSGKVIISEESATTTIVTTTEKPASTTVTTIPQNPPSSEQKYILGDVNDDKCVDSSDASGVLADYARIQTGGASELSESQKKAADVNKDDVVDSSDASKILAYYAMISTGKEPSWN